EMKPQKEFCENKEIIKKREEEDKEIFQRVYDVEHNAKIRFFNRAYTVFSVLFCISLVFLLLTAVSHLPKFGQG
ncbi:hypothetical protein RFZ01_13660, partial [Acinetobacter pittii]|uniref:hypothetical protein n=1 Tax=Acinetobacter pittii TaxID=48296 RepID=UPI0028131A36